MSKTNTIVIIGHFGGNKVFSDGQTVKTLNLYRELLEKTNWKIIKVDTYYKKNNPLKLLLNILFSLLRTKKVIILLSGNGMKILFPILNFFVKIRKTEIFNDVIGGNLANYVIKYPKYREYLNSFRGNWVETEKLKMELEEQGITNVEVIPNFRRVKLMKEDELQKVYIKPYRFCTFSRVTQTKGIEEAISAIEEINAETSEASCNLDIYGPVDEAYSDRFFKIMKTTTSEINYCGNVSFNQAISILKKYYATLFPTYWDGEGQAGTISESFFAGIPVIATDWHCNKEMIQSGYNGILYPSEHAEDLKSGIKWLLNHRENIITIKRNCLNSARYYLPDEHIKTVIKRIEGN